jgi:hypothetical protein
MLHNTDISDVLPTIRVLTLVIHRRRGADAARRVRALIPGATVVQVGTAAHAHRFRVRAGNLNK